MKSIKTTTTDANYGLAGCNELPVEEGEMVFEGKAVKTYSSYWYPDKDEIEALVNGGVVKLTILGLQPPVMVEACEIIKDGPQRDRDLKVVK